MPLRAFSVIHKPFDKVLGFSGTSCKILLMALTLPCFLGGKMQCTEMLTRWFTPHKLSSMIKS